MKTFEPRIDRINDTIRNKPCLFDSEPTSQHESRCHGDIIGQKAVPIGQWDELDMAVGIDNPLLFKNLSVDLDIVPVNITGRISNGTSDDLNRPLAVAVNGTIRAVVEPYKDLKGESRFSAIVSESSFREGENDISILILSGSDREPRLLRVRKSEMKAYDLTLDNKLITPEGKTLVPGFGAAQGFLDNIVMKEYMVVVNGWAADIENTTLPEAIVIFENRKFIYQGRCNDSRSDVAEYYSNPLLAQSGFRFELPLNAFKDPNRSAVRVYATFKGGVSIELKPNNN